MASEQQTVEVRLLLFAKAKELAGCAELRVRLPPTIGSGELYKKVFQEILPSLQPIRHSCVLAVDRLYCRETQNGQVRLEEHSEVAVIPPVSGG